IVGSRPARSLALVCPEIPKPLAAVFDRSLRFEKSERWADARSMNAVLTGATPVITERLAPVPHGLLGGPRRVWRPSFFAGASVIFVVAVAAFVAIAAAGNAPSEPAAPQEPAAAHAPAPT